MSFRPFRTGTLGVLWAAVLITAAANAQTVNGRFTGSVVDPSGSMVVGASITLTNEQTGDIRKSSANNAGEFTFPAVQPGQYSVKVVQQGFKSYQRKGMNLAANDVFSLGEIKLDVGAVTESVLVETQGSVVSTNSSEHSALLTANQTAMLQVRGREAMSLLKLLPGVTNITDEEAMGGSWGSTVPNIQGNRTNTNAVSVDGLATNDGGAPTQVSPINLDAVAEVKVLLNNYQAEYGRNGGAEIRIVTKSGTKDFHGTGYWYKRHEMFNANSWQNNRNNVPKPIYRYNNGGFTLGGPIYIPGKLNVNKDKLFFFYSGDLWQSYSPQALRTLTMPTQRDSVATFPKRSTPAAS
jgi:hypothetical protein